MNKRLMKNIFLIIVMAVLFTTNVWAADGADVYTDKAEISTRDSDDPSTGGFSKSYTRYVKWSSGSSVTTYTIYPTSSDYYVGYGCSNNTSVVKFLQGCLNKAGYRDDSGNKLTVDGVFGSKTYQAIINFQSDDQTVSVGSVDGIVGPSSWTVLMEWHLPSRIYITESNPIVCY